jgi:hypothetical protein
MDPNLGGQLIFDKIIRIRILLTDPEHCSSVHWSIFKAVKCLLLHSLCQHKKTLLRIRYLHTTVSRHGLYNITNTAKGYQDRFSKDMYLE